MLICSLMVLDKVCKNKWVTNLDKEIKLSTNAVLTIRNRLSSGATNANRFYALFVCWNTLGTVMRLKYSLRMRSSKKVVIWLILISRLSKSLLKININLSRFNPNKLKFIQNKFKKHLYKLLNLLQVNL